MALYFYQSREEILTGSSFTIKQLTVNQEMSAECIHTTKGRKRISLGRRSITAHRRAKTSIVHGRIIIAIGSKLCSCSHEMLISHAYVQLLHAMHHGVEVHVVIASVHHSTCHELLLLLLLLELLLLKIHSHHVLLVVHSHHCWMHGSSHHVALVLGVHHGIHVHVHIHVLHHHRIIWRLSCEILHTVRPLHGHHVLVDHKSISISISI